MFCICLDAAISPPINAGDDTNAVGAKHLHAITSTFAIAYLQMLRPYWISWTTMMTSWSRPGRKNVHHTRSRVRGSRNAERGVYYSYSRNA